MGLLFFATQVVAVLNKDVGLLFLLSALSYMHKIAISRAAGAPGHGQMTILWSVI